MKITRRELALSAGAVALAHAQTPPALAPPPTTEAQAQAAQEFHQRASDTLTKFEIPIATEPAFQFKP